MIRYLKKLLQDYGTKVMAVVGALLMVTFFFPNMRGGSTPAEMAQHTAATVFGKQIITVAEQQRAKNEWDILRRLPFDVHIAQQDKAISCSSILELPSWTFLVSPWNQQKYNVFTQRLNQHPVEDAISSNPNAFLMLRREAIQLGIVVGNDQLRDCLTNNVSLPDDDDSAYDKDRQAVVDLLLVRNLLDRVGDLTKISQPRVVQAQAEQAQTASLNVVELPTDRYMAATTQPTESQIQAQYAHFAKLVPGSPTDDNPLGVGYSLPDRAKVQYISCSTDDIQSAVIHSTPVIDPATDKIVRIQPLLQLAPVGPAAAAPVAIEWEVRARRLYRTHPEEFPVPTTGPSTQPQAATTPDFDHLSSDIRDLIYTQVYESAAKDLFTLARDRLTSQMAADYAAYDQAKRNKQPDPITSLQVPITSNDYLPSLAFAIQRDIGVLPIVMIRDKDFLDAKDLANLPQIGQAGNPSTNQLFPAAVLTDGDQFAAAQTVPTSQRLSPWQPSPPFYSEIVSDGHPILHFFRISAMDPTHAMPLSIARDLVIADLRTQQAWDMAVADANRLLISAKKNGLAPAILGMVPGPGMITTDYFNLDARDPTVPGLQLPLESVLTFRLGALKLLVSGSAPPVTEIKLPLDRKVDLVELHGVHAGWQNPTEELATRLFLTQRIDLETAIALQQEWVNPEGLIKRTQYQEAAK